MRAVWRYAATLAFSCSMASAALAQDAEPGAGLEIGVRYWLSTGETSTSHDASSGTCFGVPCGNPTSTLTYDQLNASSVELYARKRFGEQWFVKGNAGIGVVPNGRLIDQDFVVNQLLVLESVSGLSGKLYYATIDVGREIWKSGNTSVGLFLGYQRWNERLDAYGISNTGNAVLSFPPPLPGDNVPVISNERIWDSARLGVEWRSQRGRTRFQGELAFVPYASYRNEDSHWLRQNTLGPSPNIIATGHGTGYQFEVELRRSYPDFFGLEFGVGYRAWRLASSKGEMTFVGGTFPVVDLGSERQGVTFTVSKTW